MSADPKVVTFLTEMLAPQPAYFRLLSENFTRATGSIFRNLYDPGVRVINRTVAFDHYQYTEVGKHRHLDGFMSAVEDIVDPELRSGLEVMAEDLAEQYDLDVARGRRIIYLIVLDLILMASSANDNRKADLWNKIRSELDASYGEWYGAVYQHLTYSLQ